MKMLSHEIEYRTKDVIDQFHKTILICGCGAIGSNIAVNLVRQGFSNVVLVDFDRIEEKNLGTQVYIEHDIGRLKSETLKHILCDISSVVNVEAFTFKLTPQKIKKVTKNVDLIIDAFDNSESRQLLKDIGDSTKIPVIHGGLYEDYAEVFWNKDYIVPQKTLNTDICDYPLARNSILLLTAVLTEEIIKFITDKPTSNWSITLKDFNISNI